MSNPFGRDTVTLREATQDLLDADADVADGDERFLRDRLDDQDWGERLRRTIHRTLQKYDDAFDGEGYELSDIEEPTVDGDGGEGEQITVKLNSGSVRVYFPYECRDFEQIVDLLRNYGFDWNKQRGAWQAPARATRSARGIEELKERFESRLTINDDVAGSLKRQLQTPDVYVQYDEQNDELAVDMEYQCRDFDEIKDTIKSLGGRWDDREKVWRIDTNYEPLQKHLSEYDHVVFTDEADEAIAEHIQERKDLRELATAHDSDYPQPRSLVKDLYPYQRAGLEYMTRQKRVLLADSMGLGKTATTIAALEDAGAFPALVVQPSVAKHVWKGEYEKFAPHRTVEVMAGQSGELDEEADVLLCNYAIVHHRVEDLKAVPFRAIVCDEAHYIKSADAKRTEATLELAEHHEPEYRYALTGTPFKNRPEELISPLRFLDRLRDFGDWFRFVTRYCDGERVERPWGEYWDTSGASNLGELNRMLKETCMVRRNKKDVLDALPEKNRTFVPLDINQKAYRQKAETVVEEYLREQSQEVQELNYAIADKRRTLQKKKRSRQQTDDSDEKAELSRKIEQLKNEIEQLEEDLNSTIDTRRAVDLVKIEELKQWVVEHKMSQVRAWIDNALQSLDKLLVYGVHKPYLNELYEHYNSRSLLITGDTPSEQRKEYEQQFQNDDSIDLLFGNIEAAGESLTLTAAHTLAFFEFGWSLEHKQAEDRCHRISQDEQVNIYYLYGEGTWEEDVLDLIETKRRIFKQVFDEDVEQAAREQLQDQYIIERLVEQYGQSA